MKKGAYFFANFGMQGEFLIIVTFLFPFVLFVVFLMVRIFSAMLILCLSP